RSMNPAAACFQQASAEMAMLCEWLGGLKETAYGLAGLGDLFVTVNAGRNSRLGLELGSGLRVSEAMAGSMSGETVEGVDTGARLAVGLNAAFAAGDLVRSGFPLTCALMASIVDDVPFEIPTEAFWPDRNG
ncbi:MAG: NAD(P)H-dependent glycerol-3-phosphate dehydrogenase, partial [Hyphomicrobiales bacterium]